MTEKIDLPFILRHIRDYVEERDGEIPPTVFIAAKTPSILPLDLFPQPYWTTLMESHLKQLDASEYALVSEAWTGKFENDDPRIEDIRSGKLKITDIPLDDRDASITILRVTRAGKAEMWLSIVKMVDGKRLLEPWQIIRRKEGEEFENRYLVEW